MSAVRIHGTLVRRPEARRDLAGCWWLVLEVAPERGSARLAGRQRFGDTPAAAIACRNSAWHLRAGSRCQSRAERSRGECPKRSPMS